MAIVMAEGEINDIEEIRVDDKTVTWASSLSDNSAVEVGSGDSNFFKADPTVEGSSAESLIRVEPHYGTDGQSASSLLTTLSNWATNHKLSGIAYIVFRITWDADKYYGIPNIKVKVQGKKVSTFDSGGNETTGVYSTNPVWCLLDFLRNERYGKTARNAQASRG